MVLQSKSVIKEKGKVCNLLRSSIFIAFADWPWPKWFWDMDSGSALLQSRYSKPVTFLSVFVYQCVIKYAKFSKYLSFHFTCGVCTFLYKAHTSTVFNRESNQTCCTVIVAMCTDSCKKHKNGCVQFSSTMTLLELREELESQYPLKNITDLLSILTESSRSEAVYVCTE